MTRKLYQRFGLGLACFAALAAGLGGCVGGGGGGGGNVNGGGDNVNAGDNANAGDDNENLNDGGDDNENAGDDNENLNAGDDNENLNDGGDNENLNGGDDNENMNGGDEAPRLLTPSRSTSIGLTSDDRFLVVANFEADSVSVIEVRDANGNDVATRLSEIPVGNEPRYVAIHPDDSEAYVTNAIDGTVSVIALSGADQFDVVDTITVGNEPRGCAVTPNGTLLYVANHTDGTVNAIDLSSRDIFATVTVGGNPTAIAITNDDDDLDTGETVFVTQFYAEQIPNGPGEVFDVGKQGVVQAFNVGSPGSPTKITLSPLENSGFTATRVNFCTATNMLAVNDTFCPDTGEMDPTAEVITLDPQGAYPNQLASAIIRNERLYLPNIGAAPEPPVLFNVNVQALVHVANATSLSELANLHVNLNDQIKAETQPADVVGSLVRLFGNDLVAIDATADSETFLIVSRGGNYVFRAGLDDDGRIDFGAPDVVRYQTGNLPTGVVISSDGTRAYTNNEIGLSVTAINLENDTVITRDISSSAPPITGTDDHTILVGKLAFFTALGIPNNDFADTEIRDIIPVDFRNKASDNGWSGCGSCHPDGLADGVTWSFGTGPRQTIPLDAFFDKLGADDPDQRISNYSAVMGSITDFNNNSRGVQGGTGFVDDFTTVFAHGFTEGLSDALDAMTRWGQILRPLRMPQGDTTARNLGRGLFQDNCASCHGGPQWTKSRVIYANNPTFTADVAMGGMLIDVRVTAMGPQIVSFTENMVTLTFLDGVGTFNAAGPLELRGAGGTQGQAALGGAGFNAPSVLGIGYHAPYFHDGSAQSLDDVYEVHALGMGTIQSELSNSERDNLSVFLRSIDDRTQTFDSETDDFLEN